MLFPVLQNNWLDNAFDDFFECMDPDQLNEKLKIKINSRVKDHMDILK